MPFLIKCAGELMELSRKSIYFILCIALTIRVFSQLAWEAYWTYSLSLFDFMFGFWGVLAGDPVYAPIWVVSEALRILSCLMVSLLFFCRTKWTDENSRLQGNTKCIADISVLFMMACLHAYVWLFVDCQFIQNHSHQEFECFQKAFTQFDPQRWFMSR